MSSFDLIVLGAGAAGLTAAREGVRLGADVALLHDGLLGGECTWTGCVPSKAMLAAAAEGASFHEAMGAVQAARARVAATEDVVTLTGEGITVIAGRGTFRSPTELDIDGTIHRAKRIVVATGATASTPPIDGLADIAFLSNDTVFDLTDAPDHLAIIGGGAIGCELAQAFARLGVPVTIVESMDRLLSREEPEASGVVSKVLGADGVRVRTGVSIARVERAGGGARIMIGGDETISASHLLVATGRRACSGGFGLDDIGVAIDDRGNVVVDEQMSTNVDGVFAAGDVTGELPFTHAAARMAFVAVNNALKPRPGPLAKRFETASVPWVTFTSPEVGRVGVTEAEAAERGSARVAFVPLSEVDRGLITGDTGGFVKLVAGPRPLLRNLGGGRLLGATTVAPAGGEMIHEAALAMSTKMFVGRLAQTVHAYPTWSMAMQQAALQFFMSSNGRCARRAAR